MAKSGYKRTTKDEYEGIQHLKKMGVENKTICNITGRSYQYICRIPADKTFEEFIAWQRQVKEKYIKPAAKQPKDEQTALELSVVEMPAITEPKVGLFGKSAYDKGVEHGRRMGRYEIIRQVNDYLSTLLQETNN